jgi:hypothetical protein
MENLSLSITMLIGIAMAGWIAFEIDWRRKRLREVYNVLESKDKHITGDLEHMVELGQLKPYRGETEA